MNWAEVYCVSGSKKHTQLKQGVLPVRVGDFVKSRGLAVQGLVQQVGVRLNFGKHTLAGVLITTGDREEFIPNEDVVFIAPREWSLTPEQEKILTQLNAMIYYYKNLGNDDEVDDLVEAIETLPETPVEDWLLLKEEPFNIPVVKED